MKTADLGELLKSNAYPGRGIVIGRSEDGSKAVTAYFIMGRSVNSRNRVFTETEDGIKTEAFDPSKLSDPHLIIYSPVRVLGNKTIVTNGDQTDTIYELMDRQYTFEQSLRGREFEDDAPNYTPRISGIMRVENGEYNFAMSILKSAIPSHIQIRFPVSEDSSTLTWVTATRFLLLKASLRKLLSAEISIRLLKWYGIPSMRTTRYLFS